MQEYAIALTHAEHVTIRDLRFFATTVYAGGETNAEDISNVRLDSLQLVHPSAGKRLLGEYEKLAPTTLRKKQSNENSPPANLTMFNTSFFGAEGSPTLNLGGTGVLFENNKLEWTDWTAVTAKPSAFFDPTIANSAYGERGSGRGLACSL